MGGILARICQYLLLFFFFFTKLISINRSFKERQIGCNAVQIEGKFLVPLLGLVIYKSQC